MITRNATQQMMTAQLDDALKHIVVSNWDTLMPDPNSGLIHINYYTGQDGSLDYLTIEAATGARGHWTTICNFWAKPIWSHAPGLEFRNGLYAAEFERMMNRLMWREERFAPLTHKHGLIQIHPPSEEDRLAADNWMRVAFKTHGPVPAQQKVA